MKIDLETAEQIKHDITSMGILVPDGSLPKIIEPLVSNIVNELRYVLNLYTTQQGWSGSIEKIVLTGGASLFPRLAEAIGNALGIRTYVGDPWARVIFPQDLQPILQQLGPQFAVAIGLAMRDIE